MQMLVASRYPAMRYPTQSLPSIRLLLLALSLQPTLTLLLSSSCCEARESRFSIESLHEIERS